MNDKRVVRWAFDTGSASAYCVQAIVVDGAERVDVQRVEALENGEFVVEISTPDENGEIRTTPEGSVTRRLSADTVAIVWNHESACQTCLFLRRMSAPRQAPANGNLR